MKRRNIYETVLKSDPPASTKWLQEVSNLDREICTKLIMYYDNVLQMGLREILYLAVCMYYNNIPPGECKQHVLCMWML